MKVNDIISVNTVELSTIHPELLLTIIDAMPTGIQILRAQRDGKDRITDFIYVLVNRNARSYTGDVEGASFLSIYPGSIESFERLCEATNSSKNMETVHFYPVDDTVRWFNVTYTRFGDGVLLSHEDITNFRRTEEELLHNRQFIAHIADSTPDIIYVANIEAGRMIYVNERIADIMGIRAADAMNKSFDVFPDTIHPDDYLPRVNAMRDLLQATDDETREIEVRARVKDGSYHWFRVRDRIFKRKSDGKPSHLIGVCTDIHKEKVASLNAWEKDRQWQSLVDNMPDPIARFDNKLRYIFANKAFLAYVQMTEQQVYGKDSLEIGMPSDVAVPWMILLRKVFITGKPDRMDTYYQVNDQQLFFSTKVIPEFSEDGKVHTVLAIGQDRTSDKNAETILRQRNELLQSLVNAPGLGLSIFKSVRNQKNQVVDFEIVLLSRKGEEVTGRKDLVGKRLLEEFPSTAPAFPVFKKVVETGTSEVLELPINDGVVNGWFLTFNAKLDDGFINIWEDITVARNAEDKAAEYAHFIDAVTRATPDLVHVIDMVEKKVVYSNRNIFSTELGYSAEAAANMSLANISDVVHPDDWQTAKDHWSSIAAARDEDIVQMEFRLKANDGEWQWFSCRSRVFKRDDQGQVVQYICINQNITQHKDAREMIRKSQMHFRSLVNHTPDAITRWDSNLKLVFANKAFLQKTGLSDTEILGKNNLEMGQPEELAGPWMNKLKEVFTTGTAQEYYHEYPGPRGTLQYYTRMVPEFDAQGNLLFALAIARDITDLRHAEEKRKEDSHFIQHITETTPDILYILDLNTRQVIYTNRQIAADLGYNKEQISAMGNPVFDVMHKDDIPAMLAHLQMIKTLRDDRVVEIEYRMKAADGTFKWYIDRNAVFNRNGKGIPAEKIGIAQNITEKKEQQEQLLTTINILNQAESIIGMGTWEYNIPTREFKWSEGVYKLFNMHSGVEVNPEVYFDFALPSERSIVRRIVECIRETYEPFDEVLTVQCPGCEKKMLKVKGVPVRDKAGKPVKVIGVDFDITGAVQSAETIHQLNNVLIARNHDLDMLNSELRTFTSVAIHQYKETLRNLYTSLEYMVRNDARNFTDTGKANIRRGQAAIQKLQLLTDDIVTYSKINQLDTDLTTVDLNEIVKKVIRDMSPAISQAGANIEITSLPVIEGYPLLLSLLFYHLLDNAIKFRKQVTPPVVKIRHSMADELNFEPMALRDTPYAIISIADNGIGFEEEYAEKIFEMFFRLHEKKDKYKGSGVGLCVCRKIVTMHGGFITAEGIPAHGATFNCYFPLEIK